MNSMNYIKQAQLQYQMKYLFRGFRFSSSKIEPYVYPYNVNQQQQKSYVKKVERQLEELAKPAEQLIPRRKRRLYESPKFDTDLSSYGAWRAYGDDRMSVVSENADRVVCKIDLQPKWLLHAFGEGYDSDTYATYSTREYYFEDNNLSTFMLYDFKDTTNYKPNVEGYDYENQLHLHPRVRIQYRLTPKQFWESENFFKFRLICSKYAEHHKFKKWLLNQIEERKKQPSYDQIIDQKFGKINCYNRYQDAQTFKLSQPLIKYVNRSIFQDKSIQKKESVVTPKQQKADGKKKQKKQKKGKAEKQQTEVSQEPQKEVSLPPTVQVGSENIQFAKMIEEQFRVDEKDTVFSLGNQDQKKEQTQKGSKKKKQQKSSDKKSKPPKNKAQPKKN